MKFINIYCLALITLFLSCEKRVDYTLEGNLPDTPEFSITEVEGDPNRFVVTDLSAGNFSRVWIFTNGQPETSTLVSDTVFYNRMGEYDIALHVSSADGNGTAVNTKPVTVTQDVAGCQFKFMTEDCTEKCWRLSGAPGGVKVGPVPYSGEWYTSPDIVDTQADDLWCFGEEGVFTYNNNGSTFSACQGFVEDDMYPIPTDMTWSFAPGAGFDAQDRIEINGIWMGIEDTGPTYDIISVSDEEMVLLTPTKPCDGSPTTGWFTLTFNKAE